MEPFIWNPRQEQPERFDLNSWNSMLPGLSVGFTGRSGGIGRSPYDSLNLAYHVGDDPVMVKENRRKLVEELGFSSNSWVCGEQVHGVRVAIVKDSDRGKGYSDRSSAFQDTDALVTNVPDVLLTSFYADCVPLYFLDPVHHVVGLAHAGWKGTVGRIAEAVIETMETEYDSCRSDIMTAIGPSIGQCCYEVDEVVMSKVGEAIPLTEGATSNPNLITASRNNDRTMLNLKELNRIIMIEAGILPTHIECTSWCTSCHPDKFFSYREQNGITGRMASWIGMKVR
ncbi:peptidoglycan editing factor PgeF [Paenibacillus anaericanus]|uniref:Purine nucleoside phosphorylase n=1 Tax=Paenibacillus anaericanus TaxID=170367 RepID=A0A3S1BUQ9_9BACL|nr:peptidoglycan editing factor PgeF [Paenibacillus anaericanus]RUT47919.1 peptidoglycan editing factor PgeF [Paenibacillus anaericanus]